MKLALWALLASILAPLALGGEFTFELKPAWLEDRKPLEGVTMTVTHDPLWGQADEDSFTQFKAGNGPLPDVTINATGTTQKIDGVTTCSMKVTVTWTGEGQLPTQRLKQADGSELELRYVYAKVEASLPGYHTCSAVFQALQDRLATAYIPGAIRWTTVKGRAVYEQDQKPAADLKLVLTGEGPNHADLHARPSYKRVAPSRNQLRCEFTTDTAGNFTVCGPDVARRPGALMVNGTGYAFALDSKAWAFPSPIRTQDVLLDYGTLIVVPGGGLKFVLTDMDTGKPLHSGCNFQTKWNNRSYSYYLEPAEGSTEIGGIPAGRFIVQVQNPGLWPKYWFPTSGEVEIKPGRVVDIGALQAEPSRTAQILVSDAAGNVLPSYQINATYSGDTPKCRNFLELGRPIVVSARLTRDKFEITGLFSGLWKLTVRAEGYPAFQSTIEIPSKDSIKLVAKAGGGIEVRLLNADGKDIARGDLMAIPESSSSYETLRTITLRDYERQRPQAEGAVGPRKGNVFVDLAAGKYLLFCATAECGLLRQEVEVVSGEVKKIDLSPSPARLIVTVTEKGKPKAGVELVFVDRQTRDGRVTNVKSDSLGTALLEANSANWITVLTKAEYEALKAQEPNPMAWDLGDYQGRRFLLRFSETINASLELFDGGTTNLTVQFVGPSGAVFLMPQIMPAKSRPHGRGCTGAPDGDNFAFINLPLDTYVLIGSLRSTEGAILGFSRTIVVDQPQSQTITIEVQVGSLSLTLTADKGRSPVAGAEVLLWRDIDWDAFAQPYKRRLESRYATDVNGKLEVPLLEAGTWHVIARCYGNNSRASGVTADAANAQVSIQGSTKLSLNFSQNVGDLQVNMEKVNEDAAHYCRVMLLNERGDLVHPGDPASAYGSMWRDFNWWGALNVSNIPIGTYKVIFLGAGLLPVTTHSVKIERGKLTKLELKPEAGIQFSVTLKGWLAQPEVEEIEWVAEDAAGAVVKIPGNGFPAVTLWELGRGQYGLGIEGLTPEVKRVRIRIPGYEEIAIETDLKSGATVKTEATAKPK